MEDREIKTEFSGELCNAKKEVMVPNGNGEVCDIEMDMTTRRSLPFFFGFIFILTFLFGPGFSIRCRLSGLMNRELKLSLVWRTEMWAQPLSLSFVCFMNFHKRNVDTHNKQRY